MPLPLTVDYVATEGAPIRPQTWNRIQECIIGSKHGSREHSILPGTALVFDGTAEVSANAIDLVANDDEVIVPLPLFVGQRLRSVHLNVSNNPGADFCALEIRRTAGLLDDEASDTTGELAVTGLDHTVISGEVLWARITRSDIGGGGPLIINRVWMFYDKP
jgi:hypothetical protein